MSERNERSGLEKASSVAHTVHGALKTGKAIAAAAKGAAAGGPFGAVAGLALASKHTARNVIIVLIVLLMLPVLFIMMLPSLIFGGLANIGLPGQPILNDNAAINGYMDEIASIVDEVLIEGVADAKERIAADFATTGGDNYEVVDPFSIASHTNSFIAQYCAAKEGDWSGISLDDMRSILRS